MYAKNYYKNIFFIAINYFTLHLSGQKTPQKCMQLIKATPSEAMQLGKVFTESGMFPDIKTAQMAVVKIMAGQEMGIGPFQAMNGIHIIQGKATVGSGLMAAMVKGSGKYDYKVTSQTEKVCSIDFYQGKNKIGTSTFTIEDAKKAQTKNLDKFPANMLFARAMSNGCKWYAPDVFNGPIYTLEEIEVVESDAEVIQTPPDVLDAINVLNSLTDLSELPSWKETFKSVIKHPEVVTAALAKHSQLKTEAK